MNYIIGALIAIGVAIGGGMYFTNTQPSTGDVMEKMEKGETMMEKEGEDKMMKEGDVMEKSEGDSMEKMEKEDAMEKAEGDVMIKEEDVMEKVGDVMEKEESEDVMMKKEEVSTTNPGTFSAFSEAKLAAAQGDIVLSFTADWCPSCRALEADIEANASDIPSDLTILDLDYDSATDLKKKYGVTTQHTLVQVDNQGNMVQLWRGGNTLSSLVAKIN